MCSEEAKAKKKLAAERLWRKWFLMYEYGDRKTRRTQ